jgi:nucleoside-diphosphate-sugar epimerase
MATHLVTGGAGFVGGRLARALASRGERVRVFDRLEALERVAGIEHVRGDVLDRRAVEAAVEGVDVVHHHAALVPVTRAGARFDAVNVRGTEIVLESSRRAGCRFFIQSSSSAVFGRPVEFPITASTPPRPVEAYGRSKLEAERRVEAAKAAGLPCAIVRPRTVIGPGRLGIFEILYAWIAEGRRIYILGDGRNRFQFIHVDDLIDFLVLVAERRRPGVYNVGAETYGTLRDDLGALIRHSGSRSRVVGSPAWLVRPLLGLLHAARLSPLVPYHYAVYSESFAFDGEEARSGLGWRPRRGNVESLTAGFDWWAEHRAEARARPGRDGRSAHSRPVAEGILALLRRLS